MQFFYVVFCNYQLMRVNEKQNYFLLRQFSSVVLIFFHDVNYMIDMTFF